MNYFEKMFDTEKLDSETKADLNKLEFEEKFNQVDETLNQFEGLFSTQTKELNQQRCFDPCDIACWEGIYTIKAAILTEFAVIWALYYGMFTGNLNPAFLEQLCCLKARVVEEIREGKNLLDDYCDCSGFGARE